MAEVLMLQTETYLESHNIFVDVMIRIYILTLSDPKVRR